MKGYRQVRLEMRGWGRGRGAAGVLWGYPGTRSGGGEGGGCGRAGCLQEVRAAKAKSRSVPVRALLLRKLPGHKQRHTKKKGQGHKEREPELLQGPEHRGHSLATAEAPAVKTCTSAPLPALADLGTWVLGGLQGIVGLNVSVWPEIQTSCQNMHLSLPSSVGPGQGS